MNRINFVFYVLLSLGTNSGIRRFLHSHAFSVRLNVIHISVMTSSIMFLRKCG